MRMSFLSPKSACSPRLTLFFISSLICHQISLKHLWIPTAQPLAPFVWFSGKRLLEPDCPGIESHLPITRRLLSLSLLSCAVGLKTLKIKGPEQDKCSVNGICDFYCACTCLGSFLIWHMRVMASQQDHEFSKGRGMAHTPSVPPWLLPQHTRPWEAHHACLVNIFPLDLGSKKQSISTDRELPRSHDDGQVRHSITAADSMRLGSFKDHAARWRPPATLCIHSPGNAVGALRLLLWLKKSKSLVTWESFLNGCSVANLKSSGARRCRYAL